MVNFQTIEIAGFAPAIAGMRHPLKSYDKSDSRYDEKGDLNIGKQDYLLAKRLIEAGSPEHAKFLRQIEVGVNITAPRFWGIEFDTYKIGTTSNSQSTMHRLFKDGISKEEVFYNGGLNDDIDQVMFDQINIVNGLIDYYNLEPNEELFENIKAILPEGYLQTRMISLNYQVLRNMYKQRKNHKLSGGNLDFSSGIHTLPMNEWITEEFPTEEILEQIGNPQINNNQEKDIQIEEVVLNKEEIQKNVIDNQENI